MYTFHLSAAVQYCGFRGVVGTHVGDGGYRRTVSRGIRWIGVFRWMGRRTVLLEDCGGPSGRREGITENEEGEHAALGEFRPLWGMMVRM
jgi:hypothetical protein